MSNNTLDAQDTPQEEKSFFGIIVHSFFIIPFLIAVFCVLLFAGIHLLTRENRTAFDYLEDVKTGGLTKRWQAAFELSKILSNPDHFPQDDRFTTELIEAFEQSKHDDQRVRQYLALAMGRTGLSIFIDPLLNSLKDEKDENLPSIIYALGMLRSSKATSALLEYLNHPNARIRSITTVALGNIADPKADSALFTKLSDNEPNVQWGAALSLAQSAYRPVHNEKYIEILGNLLERKYLSSFNEIDAQEQNQILISAIEAAGILKYDVLLQKVEKLSSSDKNMKVRSAALKVLNSIN